MFLNLYQKDLKLSSALLAEPLKACSAAKRMFEILSLFDIDLKYH